MGRWEKAASQIVQQPDGKLAVYAPGCGFVLRDATPRQVVDYRVEQAVRMARTLVRMELHDVTAPHRPSPYGERTLTWEQVRERERKRTGG